MAFDPCPHQITQLVIRVGALIRELTGLPPETSITKLYNEAAPLLGIIVVQMNSKTADHLPSPGENPNWPSKPCPDCGKTAYLGQICQSCKDAEGGFKSAYLCDKRFGGCGLYFDKTVEWITQRLSNMGKSDLIQNGTKESLGIGTGTDDGVK